MEATASIGFRYVGAQIAAHIKKQVKQNMEHEMEIGLYASPLFPVKPMAHFCLSD